MSRSYNKLNKSYDKFFNLLTLVLEGVFPESRLIDFVKGLKKDDISWNSETQYLDPAKGAISVTVLDLFEIKTKDSKIDFSDTKDLMIAKGAKRLIDLTNPKSIDQIASNHAKSL